MCGGVGVGECAVGGVDDGEMYEEHVQMNSGGGGVGGDNTLRLLGGEVKFIYWRY